MKRCGLILALLGLATLAAADTPANCTYEDIKGFWMFEESEPTGTRTENCTKMPAVVRKVHVKLDYPNIAIDDLGHVGHWNLIYNQGFEVIINYRKYFAFSKYEQKGNKVVSYCHQTLPGWAHDMHGNNWACFQGHKVDNAQVVAQNKIHEEKPLLHDLIDATHALSESYVNALNSEPSLWQAYAYPHLQGISKEELIGMSGGRKSRLLNRPKPKEASEELRQLAAQLPESWDWRNVNGVNYVAPVRNQGSCGSCYIFASMEMLEARIRIQTNNTQKPVFSIQSVMDCSEYSQGCAGGYPYLIAGKYAQDFGLVAEQCNHYKGYDSKCFENTTASCKQRYFTFDYYYVGGYFGGCNEEAMMLELVNNGPVSVAFEAYPEFGSYRNGIYEHKTRHVEMLGKNDFNPYEVLNHGVLVVGYGKDAATGHKYWIVQNSWGTNWGMDGFFYIRRGTDECGIESIAIAAIPMPV